MFVVVTILDNEPVVEGPFATFDDAKTFVDSWANYNKANDEEPTDVKICEVNQPQSP